MTHRKLAKLYTAANAANVQLGAPDVLGKLQELPEYASMNVVSTERDARWLVTSLRAIDVAARESIEDRMDLVASVPAGITLSGHYYKTDDVLWTMIAEAREDILVVAFEANSRELWERLRQFMAKPNRRLRVVTDSRVNLKDIRHNWPATCHPDNLELRQYVERADLGSKFNDTRTAIFHAKVLVVDHTKLLVGSANFTNSALNDWNFELGVRFESTRIANTLWTSTAELPSDLFRRL